MRFSVSMEVLTPMSTALSLTHTFVRIVGLAVTVLGVTVFATHNLPLLPVYATSAVALMLGLWTFGVLATRAGVHAGAVAVTVVLGMVAPLVSLTGEWTLYVLAGVGGLAQCEDLALRIRRQRLAHAP